MDLRSRLTDAELEKLLESFGMYTRPEYLPGTVMNSDGDVVATVFEDEKEW